MAKQKFPKSQVLKDCEVLFNEPQIIYEIERFSPKTGVNFHHKLINSPVTRSITGDHKKLVPEPVSVGCFHVFHQQFGAFMKIYQEGKATTEKRQ